MLEVDATGLPCPMPLIKLKKAMAACQEGTLKMMMRVSDKGALRDIPAFCESQGLGVSIVSEVPPYQLLITRLNEQER